MINSNCKTLAFGCISKNTEGTTQETSTRAVFKRKIRFSRTKKPGHDSLVRVQLTQKKMKNMQKACALVIFAEIRLIASPNQLGGDFCTPTSDDKQINTQPKLPKLSERIV